MALRKISPGFPAREQLRIHRQAQEQRGIMASPSTPLTPTACRMSLLQTQSGAQSCCITWQTSLSSYCLPGVFSSQDRSRGSSGSGLGEHWEPQAWTGLAQDSPTHGKSSQRKCPPLGSVIQCFKAKTREEVKSFMIFFPGCAACPALPPTRRWQPQGDREGPSQAALAQLSCPLLPGPGLSTGT